MPAMDLARLPVIVTELAVLLFAVSVHESAHGWVADRLGDHTARDLGRITLNPIRHIDLVGSIVFPLILAAMGAPVFGWAKPVPVDARNLRDPRRSMSLVAAAGPLSNLALAVASVAGLVALRLVDPAVPGLVTLALSGRAPLDGGVLAPIVWVLVSLLIINLLLAVFNLLPIPPLDGSGIVAGLLPPRVAATYRRVGPWGMVVILALLWLGALNGVFAAVFHAMTRVLFSVLGP